MRILILFSLFSVVCFKLSLQQSSAVCGQDILSMVMIVDASGSVGENSFNLAKQTTIDMIKQMNVGPNKVHVGYIVYDHRVAVISSLLANDQDRQRLIANINNINYYSYAGSTNTADALEMANTLFKALNRPVVPRIAVLLTDGYSNSLSQTVAAATRLKANDVEIFAIGITPYVNDAELTQVASGTNYLMKVQDYTQLYAAVNQITQIACDASAFMVPGQKVAVESPPGQKRNFQTDLTKLGNQSTAKAPIVLIDMDVFAGTPVLTYSLNEPLSSQTRMVEAKPAEERINADNSRTITFWVFPSATDTRLYYSVKASSGADSKYDLSLRVL